MSRRAFVVAGIVECLQPDRGGWELIDSRGVFACYVLTFMFGMLFLFQPPP